MLLFLSLFFVLCWHNYFANVCLPCEKRRECKFGWASVKIKQAQVTFITFLTVLSAFCVDEVEDKNGLNAYDYLPSSLRAGLKDSF